MAGRPRQINKIVPKKHEVQKMTIYEALDATKETALQKIDEMDFDGAYANYYPIISSEILKPCRFKDYLGTTSYREAKDIEYAYQVFRDITSEIAKHINYTPTVLTFCTFIGVSITHFKTWCDEVNERGDVCTRIKNELSDYLLQGSLNGKLEKMTSIFAMKALGDLRDGDNAQLNVVNINSQKSNEEILEQFYNKLSGK